MLHAMIDCYQSNEHRLNDLAGMNDFLNHLVAQMKFKSVMPPFLIPYYYASEGSDNGISAFVIFEGGHITIHTFPYRECFFVDILVDGYFDLDKCRTLLKEQFLYKSEKIVRTERRYLDTTIERESIFVPGEGKKGMDFGPHIIARVEKAFDVTMEKIYDMLDEIPELVNMLPISRPYVIKSSKTNAKYISGIVLIAQSHIAFHYEIASGTLYCDMFSCSFYKNAGFLDYLNSKFKCVEAMTLIRGSKHQEQIRDEKSRLLQLNKWKSNAR